MRDKNSTLTARANAAVLAAGLLALVAASQSAADSSEPASYTWSAELVQLDAAANTVTVKARLVEHPDAGDVAALQAGDRAMLTWSGISTAAGIRAIEPGDRSSFDRMTMPVEFVSSELDGRYVSFKVPVPAADVQTIEQVMPGQWVTATSPLQADDPTEAVSSIRPYNHVG